MYKMKVAIYIRVSTQEQALEGYSIGAQEERLKAYCKAKNWNVFKVYSDPGFSGANTDRPALQSLINDVMLKKVDMVLVYKLDRLSRSQKDTLNLVDDVFLKNGIDFVSMNENFDTSTPLGRAMLGILSVFAQLEREQIKERMAMGREARAKQGKWHGSNFTAFGYKYIDKKLVVDEYEASLVQEIFNRYIKGDSASSLASEMFIRYPSYKNFNHGANAITDILRRKTYLGYIISNDNEYEGEHDAIITQEVFDEAQKVMKTKESFNRHKVDSEHLLTGLLYCKQCNGRYSNVTKNYPTKKKDGSLITYSYSKYMCYTRSKIVKAMMTKDNCTNKIWKSEELENVVINEVRKLKFNGELKVKTSEIKIDVQKIISTKLKDIDNQINKLIDLYSVDGIDIALIQSKIKVLNDQKDSMIKSINDQYQEQEKIEEFKDNLNQVDEVFEYGSNKEKRLLLMSLIEKIELDGNNVEIHWNF